MIQTFTQIQFKQCIFCTLPGNNVYPPTGCLYLLQYRQAACGQRKAYSILNMKVLISKGRFQAVRGLGAIVLTIVLFLFSMLSFQNAFSFQYLQIDRLLFAIALTLFFLYIFFKLFEEYKAVSIYETYLKIKWLFGLISLRLDKDMLTQFGKSSVNNINYIYLNTEKHHLLFNETVIENNFELVEQLREWRIKRKDNLRISETSSLENKIGGIVMMIFGVLLGVFGLFNSYFQPIETSDIKDLFAVSGHLSKKPNVKNSTLRSASTDVTFELEEYRGFRFQVGHPGYKAIKLSALSNYKKEDKITLLITKNNYSKKIARNSTPSFSEKHFNWARIQAYAIEIKEEKVLQLDEFNKEALKLRNSNQKWGFVVIGLSVLMFWYGLKIFRQQV